MKAPDHKVTWPFKQVIMWGSVKELKTLNITYHDTYCDQTCQGGDLLWESPSLKSHDPLSCDFHFFLFDLFVFSVKFLPLGAAEWIWFL